MDSPAPPHPPEYYPVFLDLRGKPCLVVGGGRIALRKAEPLIRAGALVTLISPDLTPEIERLAGLGSLTLIRRPFDEADLDGMFLVIAATDDEDVNQAVARHSRVPTNVVDRPELCSFIVPSSLRRGPLQVAVSTSGASPAMARALREEIEGMMGPGVGPYLMGLAALRREAMRLIPDASVREGFLSSLGSAEIVRAIGEGRQDELLEEARGRLMALAVRGGARK